MKDNKLDPWYQSLLSLLVSEDQSFSKSDRTGTGTKSLFGVQFRHDMSDGFPLLTTKKMAFKTMVTELLWFLRGDTNIKYLVDNGCNIWNGDAYKNYLKECKRLNIIKVDTPVVKIRVPIPYTQEELINKIKTDDEFAKTWGELGKIRVPIPYTQEEFINKIKTDDEFANKWGELGKIYGAQWRSWHWRSEPVLPEEKDMIYTTEGKPVTWSEEKYIDQIANLINELKTNPDSRRMLVSAWNVGELNTMILPPCHYGFQMYTRELSLGERVNIFNSKMIKEGIRTQIATVGVDDSYWRKSLEETKHDIPTRAITLMWNQRSVDTALGLPINIASYALLLLMIADEVNMVPDQLIGNLGDVHLYSDHLEGAKEQMTRTPYELPTVHVRDGIFCSSVNDVILQNYKCHPKIYFPLSN